MNLWYIAWSYLWNRKLVTCMTIASLALSVALISATLTLREETRRRFEEEGQAFDMVVGAKGDPLQLVLSTVYYMGLLTGNMSYEDYVALKDNENVSAAFPIGMGDTYRGYRIVGTTRDLFDYGFENLKQHPFEFAAGRVFQKPLEAVVGATAAQETGLKVGDTFTGLHGFIPGGEEHEDHPYEVVGLLELSGTPFDRAIFCDIESVWDLHDHGGEDDEHGDHEHGEACASEGCAHGPRDEVTAVLVDLPSPAMRYEFKDWVNANLNAMAAIPVNEIKKLYDQLLGIAKNVLLAIGYLVVVISAFSILIGLYMAILQRRRDLAIMRALGASKGEIFGAVIIEAFWVTLLGLGAGWLLGTAVVYFLGAYLASTVGLSISAVSYTPDLVTAYSAVVLMGLIAGILPAWQAYRTDVAKSLAEL